MRTSGDVFHIPTSKVFSRKRNADDMQMERSVGALTVRFKRSPR